MLSQIENNGNKCIWYGICDRVPVLNSSVKKIKNCLDDKSPRALNESGVEALSKWCSHLVSNGNASTCCDIAQVS